MFFLDVIRKKIGLYENKNVIVLYNLGLTPMRATLLSILFVVIFLFFIYIGNLLYAGISLILYILFDGLDGMIARAIKQTTKIGYYLDMGTGYIMRLFAYLLIAYSGFSSYKLAVLVIIAVFLTPFFIFIINRRNLKINNNLPALPDVVWIFFVLFTGHVPFFLYLIIITGIIFFIINVVSVVHLNIRK